MEKNDWCITALTENKTNKQQDIAQLLIDAWKDDKLS